ncbi:MAG: FMN-binding glutamate synthase family protein [Rhodospirillaceae bacterium]|nr:FMN-binding glutamate synthase family protein [Rhodospirillaceae bacterium]
MNSLIQDIATSTAYAFIELFVLALILLIGVGLIAVLFMYVVDKTQTKHAIRRNYPVIGRFRYLFEELGEYFRQYFFAMDREEMPFNRSQRSWVYRAAKGVDTTAAFGSTRDIRGVGNIYFVSTPYPTLETDAVESAIVTIGPTAKAPYEARSLFNISGMSYGAISKPAVSALSNGARMAGCWMNTGEGGLSPFHLEGGADIVFQIGTAKYGVRDEHGALSDEKLRAVAAHEQVKMFELKISQGAKPGKGGILPAAKVSKEISEIRGIPVGQASISPNRHPEIDSIPALLDMVDHIRTVTGKPAGFKMVLGGYEWMDKLCRTIVERGLDKAPDFITIDSSDGGTGAAPPALMDYMGLPLSESLPAVANKLREHGLKGRVKLIASGKLINPAEIAWALCVGADFITSARGFMFALGCIQAFQCNKNTCPTGITTHDSRLQKGLNPENKAERVRRYVETVLYEVGVIAHSCGVPEPRQLRRRHVRVVTETGRSKGLDEIFPWPNQKEDI